MTQLYTLPPALFAQAFPFHLGFDRALQIVQVGEALQRIHPTQLLGEQLDDQFQLHSPAIAFEAVTIQKKLKSLFVLQSRHSPLQLKGEIVDLVDEQVMLFLCSVWVSDSTDLSRLGVKFKDFAIHDLTPDFLFLQRTSRTAIGEIKTLTEELTQQKAQLQVTLQVQETLTQAAKTQAQQLEQTLSELQKTQIQLIQAEKMSSLGQLVAGIAHEINNPVNFIHGNLIHTQQYIQDLLSLIQLYQLEEVSSVQIEAKINEIDLDFLQVDLSKVLESMQTGTERIKDIVQSLRIFSRLDEAELKVVDIHQSIDSVLILLNNRLKAKDRPSIEVIKHYGEIPHVECYARDLNQVLMNVLVNAIEALEFIHQDNKDNRLIIEIRTQPIAADQIEIVIADTGIGIPEQLKPRIFDPFFTTKPVGQGTGMGLSTSYQIVSEQHKGKISCDSILGKGTKFVIQIPTNQTNPKQGIRYSGC